MPKIAVNKSIVIAVTPEKAFETIRDFRQWNRWSPWVICEPDCQMTYADDGKSYAWDGKVIGSGSVEMADEQKPQAIDYRLTFLKPWKSKATFSFVFQPEGDGVRVIWTMDSSLPWFLFFMKGMMTAMIGMDYDRGLRMLKDYLETGNVHSKLEYPGQTNFEGFRYVGIRSQSSMAQIGDQMKADFEKYKSGALIQELEVALVSSMPKENCCTQPASQSNFRRRDGTQPDAPLQDCAAAVNALRRYLGFLPVAA